MREKLQLIMKHLRQGSLQKMWKQTIWIYQYGKRYWKSMILYTLLGVMGSCVSLASSLISKDLVDIITGHQTGRLMDIVEMPQEDYSQDHAVKLFEKQHKTSGIGLTMKDLSYTYHSGTEVFAHASMEAYPHEIIALVGPSGEGKTTMLRLILSLLRAQSGEFQICAGSDHNQKLNMSPSTRKLFSYVPQGNTMFSGTIAENMRNVKPDATDEEIIEALKLSCA